MLTSLKNHSDVVEFKKHLIWLDYSTEQARNLLESYPNKAELGKYLREGVNLVSHLRDLDRSDLAEVIQQYSCLTIHELAARGDQLAIGVFLYGQPNGPLDEESRKTLLSKPDHDGFTPLYHAVKNGHKNIAKYLLEEMQNPNMCLPSFDKKHNPFKLNKNDNVLTEIIRDAINDRDLKLLHTIFLNNPELISTSILPQKGIFNQSPLEYAKATANLEVALLLNALLLEKQRDKQLLAMKAGHETDLIVHAASFGDLEYLNKLLERYHDGINRQVGGYGDTALQSVILNKRAKHRKEIVHLLLEKGADLTVVKEVEIFQRHGFARGSTYENHRVDQLADANPLRDELEKIYKKLFVINLHSSERKNPVKTKSALEKIPAYLKKNLTFWMLLNQFCMGMDKRENMFELASGSLDAATFANEICIKALSNPVKALNLSMAKDLWNSILQEMLRTNQLDKIKTMFESENNPYSKKDFATLCFLYACTFKNAEILMYSIEVQGADINAKDKDGMTALDWASIKHSEEIVFILLQLGAKLPVSFRRNSVLQKHLDVVHQLIELKEQIEQEGLIQQLSPEQQALYVQIPEYKNTIEHDFFCQNDTKTLRALCEALKKIVASTLEEKRKKIEDALKEQHEKINAKGDLNAFIQAYNEKLVAPYHNHKDKEQYSIIDYGSVSQAVEKLTDQKGLLAKITQRGDFYYPTFEIDPNAISSANAKGIAAAVSNAIQVIDVALGKKTAQEEKKAQGSDDENEKPEDKPSDPGVPQDENPKTVEGGAEGKFQKTDAAEVTEYVVVAVNREEPKRNVLSEDDIFGDSANLILVSEKDSTNLFSETQSQCQSEHVSDNHVNSRKNTASDTSIQARLENPQQQIAYDVKDFPYLLPSIASLEEASNLAAVQLGLAIKEQSKPKEREKASENKVADTKSENGTATADIPSTTATSTAAASLNQYHRGREIGKQKRLAKSPATSSSNKPVETKEKGVLPPQLKSPDVVGARLAEPEKTGPLAAQPEKLESLNPRPHRRNKKNKKLSIKTPTISSSTKTAGTEEVVLSSQCNKKGEQPTDNPASAKTFSQTAAQTTSRPASKTTNDKPEQPEVKTALQTSVLQVIAEAKNKIKDYCGEALNGGKFAKRGGLTSNERNKIASLRQYLWTPIRSSDDAGMNSFLLSYSKALSDIDNDKVFHHKLNLEPPAPSNPFTGIKEFFADVWVLLLRKVSKVAEDEVKTPKDLFASLKTKADNAYQQHNSVHGTIRKVMGLTDKGKPEAKTEKRKVKQAEITEEARRQTEKAEEAKKQAEETAAAEESRRQAKIDTTKEKNLTTSQSQRDLPIAKLNELMQFANDQNRALKTQPSAGDFFQTKISVKMRTVIKALDLHTKEKEAACEKMGGTVAFTKLASQAKSTLVNEMARQKDGHGKKVHPQDLWDMDNPVNATAFDICFAKAINKPKHSQHYTSEITSTFYLTARTLLLDNLFVVYCEQEKAKLQGEVSIFSTVSASRS